jgi:hypothetical protein
MSMATAIACIRLNLEHHQHSHKFIRCFFGEIDSDSDDEVEEKSEIKSLD